MILIITFPARSNIKQTMSAKHTSLHDSILHSEDFKTILVQDYSSTCPKRRYDYNRGLVVPVKCVPLVEITCILFRDFLKA